MQQSGGGYPKKMTDPPGGIYVLWDKPLKEVTHNRMTWHGTSTHIPSCRDLHPHYQLFCIFINCIFHHGT